MCVVTYRPKRNIEARLGNIFLSAIKIFDLSLRLSASGFILLRPKWLFEIARGLEIISTCSQCSSIEIRQKIVGQLAFSASDDYNLTLQLDNRRQTRRMLRGF